MSKFAFAVALILFVVGLSYLLVTFFVFSILWLFEYTFAIHYDINIWGLGALIWVSIFFIKLLLGKK